MREDAILTHQQNITVGQTITAQNAADQVNKLRQILLGSIKNPKTGLYETIDHHLRTQDLVDQIEMAKSKVIIIFPFKGIIRVMNDELSKLGYTTAVMNGDVSMSERGRIVRRFKTQIDPHILLCHSKVMSHGLNLTEADRTIFYGPIFSNDDYRQVIERNQGELVSIEHPTTTLEELFLSIVRDSEARPGRRVVTADGQPSSPSRN